MSCWSDRLTGPLASVTLSQTICSGRLTGSGVWPLIFRVRLRCRALE